MSRLIPLSASKFAIVDDADFDWLTLWKWSCNADGYAVRREGNKILLMHRFLIAPPNSPLQVDHANRNRLDNRRSNLRLATRSEQAANRSIQSNNRAGYKGIYLTQRGKPWRAYIKCQGAKYELGYFATKEEAAAAYDLAAVRLFGAFACTNAD